MKTISIACLGVLAALVYGCTAGDPAAPGEPLATDEAELTDGCYLDCPGCKDGVCELCKVVCMDGVACGDIRCAVGEVCCNANCGTCVKPGDACDAQTRCNKEPECGSDADCTLTADYCAECDCVALSVELDQLPACGSQNKIACFSNPCANKKAVCQSGQCVAE